MAGQWTETYAEEVRDTALAAVEELKTVALQNFDVFWNNNQGPIQSGISLADDILINWTQPVIPELPEFESTAELRDLSIEEHNTYVWDTEGEEHIKETILNTLSNYGIGISQSFQDAMFQADRDRKLLALSDALYATAARYGAKGFRYPNSVVQNAQNEIILKYQYDLENQSREITKLIEEHARTNIQFAVQQGIAFENFHADFANKYDQLFIELEKAAVDIYVKEIEAEIARYKASILNTTTRLELAKLEADYLGTIGNIAINKYKTDVEQETARTSLTLNEYLGNFGHKLQALQGYATTASKLAGVASSIDLQYTRG